MIPFFEFERELPLAGSSHRVSKTQQSALHLSLSIFDNAREEHF